MAFCSWSCRRSDKRCFVLTVEDGAEGRLIMQEGQGQGTLHQSCTISLLHDLFLILFTEVIFTLFCSLFFFLPMKQMRVFCPYEFPDSLLGFFFLLTCMICSFEEDSSLVTHSSPSPEENPVFCATNPTKNHGEVCIRKACSCL